jgi:hypothetical protein
MQILRRTLLLLIAAVLAHSCADENESPRYTGEIQFSFNPNETIKPDGRIAADFPDGSYLIVTIQRAGGTPVFTRERVELVRVGDEYIGEPLAIPEGNFKLTDFWVVSPTRVLLYAAPKEGAPLADLVDDPLPQTFSVSKDQLSNVGVQVIDVTGSSPQDFGYVSFEFDIIRKLQISVFTTSESGLTLSPATVTLLDGIDTLQLEALEAKVNTIAFTQNPDDTVTLAITKPGYARYARKVTFNQLKEELDGDPLTVVLAPAVTFVALSDITNALDYSIRVSGPSGEITIDWGDGTSGIYSLDTDDAQEHDYAHSGKYFVSITGDLTSVTDFYSFYGGGPMVDHIDVSQLTEMVDIRIGLTVSPPSIDLTKNKKLTGLMLIGNNMSEILIAPDNILQTVSIDGPNNFTTASLDAFVNVLYQSVVESDRTEGYISLYALWYETGNDSMIGPPSEEALTKLRSLRDDYGWAISPNP